MDFPAYGGRGNEGSNTMIRKMTITLAALAVILGFAAPAQADTYPTRRSETLFQYGPSSDITTWLAITHRKQDDGDGTAIEGASVETVAFCAFLNETGNRYAAMTLTVSNYNTGQIYTIRDFGSETPCRTFKDVEIGSSVVGDAPGALRATVTVIACVEAGGGNDQYLRADWKVIGANADLVYKDRQTRNTSAC